MGRRCNGGVSPGELVRAEGLAHHLDEPVSIRAAGQGVDDVAIPVDGHGLRLESAVELEVILDVVEVVGVVQDGGKLTNLFLGEHHLQGGDRLCHAGWNQEFSGKLPATSTEVKLFPDAFHEAHNGPDKAKIIAAMVAWLKTQTAA